MPTKPAILFFTLILTIGIPFLNAGDQNDLSGKDLESLISLSDRYCSMFIWEGALPKIKILDKESRTEMILMKNGDTVYLNKNGTIELREGLVFLVIEIGPKIKNFGRLAWSRGRARITMMDDRKAAAELEHICGQVKVGHFLIPFEEKEGLLGKDLGFDVPVHKNKNNLGHFLYLHEGLVQIGTGHRAIIDLGTEDGLNIGDQILVCRRNSKNAFLRAFANMVVINAQSKTSTVKILSCKDAVRITDRVTLRPKDAAARDGVGTY